MMNRKEKVVDMSNRDTAADVDDIEHIEHSQQVLENNEDEDWWDAEEQPRLEPTPDSSVEPAKETKKPHIDEAELRKKIISIQSNNAIDRQEKARMIQYLMSHGSLPSSHPMSSKKNDMMSDEEALKIAMTKSYNNEKEGILGCKHYQRKVKLQANCCKRIFTCRFCHDEACDHAIVRTETKNMLCMLCQTLQPAAQDCSKCGVRVARYYCDKCKLWDDDLKKSIYHCDDCGICRQGQGLGKDYFHCQKCNICMIMSMKDKHRCIERSLESDCPICGEYMFTSTTTVIFMRCGHCIHKACCKAYIQTSYQCPTCLKSLGDMTEYFSRLDRELERQPMPAEYEKYVSHIFCNDCEKKSPAKYHFFYHKCAHCESYNTTVLRTENTEETKASNDDDTAAGQQSSSSNPTAGSSSNPDSHALPVNPILTTVGTEDLEVSSNSDIEQIMQTHTAGTACNGNSSSSSAQMRAHTSNVSIASSSSSSSSSSTSLNSRSLPPDGNNAHNE